MRSRAGLAAAVAISAGLTMAVPTADATGRGTTQGAGGQVTRSVPKAGAVARSAVNALRAHPNAAKIGKAQKFKVVDALVDANGSTHVRMTRTYRGLRVLGGDLVVHRSAKGAWRGTSQTLDRKIALSARPSVQKSVAVTRALGRTSLSRTVAHQRVKAAPTLVVDATGKRPQLAWEVIATGRQKDGTPSRIASYVNAKTGKLIRSEQQIETADGTGRTLYSGNVPLQVTLSGSTYSLKDATRGGTYTNDVNNKTDSILCTLFGFSCQVGTTVTSTSSTFGNNLNSNRASAAADAQYGTNLTWDYYKNVHGRNGIFGTGAGSWNRVHYGSNYVNAFWDGTKMTYGDGNGTAYGPLVSLDVAGHEMSHGVTEHSANLTYSGESGGLNESTSDIFGSLVEFYANNASDPGDYLIGERFDLAKHLGLRRMDNPASDGSSANCWSSSVGNLDVHYSSGVGNHFFYLLAEGSAPKTLGGVAHATTTCNGSTITGIGRDAAGKIWYKALTAYMTSSTNYAGARTASLNAARDIYGQGSTQYNAVAAAWSAVSVN